MSDKSYKYCPYSDEFMRKIHKENHEFKLPPIIKYGDKIPKAIITFDVINSAYPDEKYERITEEH